MSSHLIGGRLNVSLVQEALRKELLNLLQKCEGPKITIWDEWLAGPVGLVAELSLLKENEVIEMLPLKPGILPAANVKHYIFIARPKIELMDLIAEYVLMKAKQKTTAEFHIFMVPRKSELCEKHLGNRGVLGSISIREFPCYIVPFEADLMSMELQNDFREFHVEGDPTCLFYAAHALKMLQDMFGTFPSILGKGQAATHVYEVFSKLVKEENEINQRIPAISAVDQVLLLDRSVDLTAVLATQLTYEGLIDELYGIKTETVTLPASVFATQDAQSPIPSNDKKKIVLNSSDEVYREIRDKTFNAVCAILPKKSRSCQNELDENHKDKTVQELKHFVSRLRQLLAQRESLATHISIAGCVKEEIDSFEFNDLLEFEETMLHCIDNDKPCPYIEDLIAQKAPLVKVLRLICLQCSTGSGLKPKVLEYYKKELVQVYGLKTWLTLCKLEASGLLTTQTGNRNYTVLKKALNLTEESNEAGRNYLSTKYTPITIRLAEHIAKNKGWIGVKDILGAINGPNLEKSQTANHRLLPARRNSLSSENSSIETCRTVLVVFLGGCTYSEVSALRSLSLAEESSVEFVILTTKLINGNSLIQSLIEN